METETETINTISHNNNIGDEKFFEKLAEDLKSAQIWIEAICMKHKFTIPQIKKLIDDFILHLKTQGGEKKKFRDSQSHFDYWLNKLPKEKLPFKSNSKIIM
jgi:hypothetical protein